jgi:serine protease Do
LTAAPDIADFNSSWNTPGIIVKSSVGLVEALDPDEMLLDEEIQKACTYDDRYTSTHSVFDRTYTVVVDLDEPRRHRQHLCPSPSPVRPDRPGDPVDFVAVDSADRGSLRHLPRQLLSGPGLANPSPSGPAFTTVVDESGTSSLRGP